MGFFPVSFMTAVRNRGDDDTLQLGDMDIPERKHVFQIDAVLVGRFDMIGRNAELMLDLCPVHAADDDVAVADVDC